MQDTVAGLFRTRSEADRALGKLKEAGFGPEQVELSTPLTGRRGHYGTKVLIGIVAGAIVGAIVRAIVTGMVPGTHALVAGNKLALFALAVVAGLGTGGVGGRWLRWPPPATVRSSTRRKSSRAGSWSAFRLAPRRSEARHARRGLHGGGARRSAARAPSSGERIAR